MKPRFHRAAERELEAAMETGESRAVGLGQELLTEVRRVVVLLCDTPGIGAAIDPLRRQFPLRRFPFRVIYRVSGDTLRILALAHRRQRPGFWSTRR